MPSYTVEVWTLPIVSGYKRHKVLSRPLEEGQTSEGSFILCSPTQLTISKISVTTVGVYSFLQNDDVIENFNFPICN